MKSLKQIAFAAGIAFIAMPMLRATAEDPRSTPAEIGFAALENGSSTSSLDPAMPDGAASLGFERGIAAEPVDPCLTPAIMASPSRPYWDAGAATTPCGNVETDFGWLLQPMGGGVTQRLLVSSIRYGLTPRVDLRWGATNHIAQSGGGLEQTEGSGDESVSVTYRFHEQGRWSPAMAFSYGFTLPEANPEKGFGSGFIDHQFLFIASRDLGTIHADFNVVGTLTGEEDGHDGAVQFGLALTRPVTSRLSLILETYGGPQPETPERFGAALIGGSYMLRPWLVLDGAYTRTYTAGSPRQQVLFGITFARRPGFAALPKNSLIGRLLGR